MRVQVKVADDMVKKIDNYCTLMGVSRSALCSIAIGQYIMNLDKAGDIVAGVVDSLKELVKDALKDEIE